MTRTEGPVPLAGGNRVGDIKKSAGQESCIRSRRQIQAARREQSAWRARARRVIDRHMLVIDSVPITGFDDAKLRWCLNVLAHYRRRLGLPQIKIDGSASTASRRSR